MHIYRHSQASRNLFISFIREHSIKVKSKAKLLLLLGDFVLSPCEIILRQCKWLKLVLEGFVVRIHKGACETGLTASGLDLLFAKSRVHCDNRSRQIGLNHDYSMTFFYFAHWMLVRICCSKREPFPAPLPLLRHVMPLCDRKCCLIMPVVKGRCARSILPRKFNISVFKCVETILSQ